VGWSTESVGCSSVASGQTMRSDFFVWTAGLSALEPKLSVSSGHGFAE
jgi:hypothetical protein